MGLTRRQVAERFDAILAFAGLERFVDQQLNYSSGMLLRLAYAISIQVPFEILLLDEALAVGDAEFQQKCFQTFDEMQSRGEDGGLVSHDLDAVSRFDRALLLQHGTIAAIGEVDDVILESYRPDVMEATSWALGGRRRVREGGDPRRLPRETWTALARVEGETGLVVVVNEASAAT